ncbi:dihydrolipoyl dehydrogenase [Candidatus Woesearchaeota archaeon]|nr:dihydrolipoyl dehydrogenase [Candidatus Woesearchaeota archaeon]
MIKIPEYDAVIIGSGPAGYTCAIRISQLHGKACVVEKDLAGGICTNWGCIPTKAMLSVSKVFEMIKKSSRFGINADNPNVDFSKVCSHRDRVVMASRKGIESLLKANNVDLISGNAELVSETEVRVNEQVIKAKNIVIATGSSPLIPGFIRLSETVLSSKGLLQIKEIPAKLIVVGGGVIGMEFATLFSSLGTEVTVVEMLDKCLSICDNEISEELEKIYRRKGINLLTKHKVLSVEGNNVKVQNLENNAQLDLNADKILVAIGRRANLNIEELDKFGIAYDKKGIAVDGALKTNKPTIYAIGDITGKSILAHVGIHQGIIAAENIMGHNAEMEYTVPACIYTNPEVAEAGLKENEAESPLVGKFPFIANGRARGEAHTEGFVKVVIKDDLIVGCQMLGHNVTEFISEAAVAIKNKIPAKEIMNTIHPHPTYAEALKEAIADAYNEAIDLMPKA